MPIKTAEVAFTTGMHFEAETDSGRRFAYDDDPTGGLGPLESVLTSLAACSAMDVVSILTKKRQAVTGYWVEVVGNQRDEYPQVYTDVCVTHEVEGRELSEAAIRRAIELSATKYCPVSAMIAAGATVVHHRYKIRSEGEVDFAIEGEVLSTGPYRRPDVIAG